jgi:hypothetical protein
MSICVTVFLLIFFGIFRHICKVCSVGEITCGFVTGLELQNFLHMPPGLLLFPALSNCNLPNLCDVMSLTLRHEHPEADFFTSYLMVIKIITIIYLTANGLSPGGSG